MNKTQPKKAYLTLAPLTLKNSKGQPVQIQEGKIVWLDPQKAGHLLATLKITSSWADWLSDNERQLLPQKTKDVMQAGKLLPEESEVQAVHLIIADRIIPSKCDRCERKDSCMLPKGMRKLCETAK